MLEFRCEGAPRDLGWDQGRACHDALRGLRVRGWRARLRGLRLDPQTAALARDMRRYFPHQAEQLEGIARGSGVSFPVLLRAMAATLREPMQSAVVECEDGLGLACAAPADAVLRRAHPEGRFPAVELTRPGLTTALAAVNEQGLAAALAGRFGSRGGCQAPAALLIRDCVERFDRVEAAVDWCMTRPAAPGTTILLADSTGALASVAITATAREILTPTIGGAGASFTHVLHPRGAGLAPLSPRAACASP